jgi:hypothetical protein
MLEKFYATTFRVVVLVCWRLLSVGLENSMMFITMIRQ